MDQHSSLKQVTRLGDTSVVLVVMHVVHALMILPIAFDHVI